MDIKQILVSANPQQYKFPAVSEQLTQIIPSKPNDIQIVQIDTKEKYFQEFIKQVKDWLCWFNKFLIAVLPIVEWLKSWNVQGMDQLFRDLYKIRSDSSITVIELKTTIERTLKLLRSFNNLPRLCHLFNCFIPFQITDSGTLMQHLVSKNFIRDLKRFHPNFRIILFYFQKNRIATYITEQTLPYKLMYNLPSFI